MRYCSMFILSLLLSTVTDAQFIYKRTMKLMGCGFEVTVVADNQTDGERYIDLAVTEIQRIEKLISSWDPTSQTSLINNSAGIRPVEVDDELFELIRRSLGISGLTDGAFDITYASMDRLWRFDGKMVELPSPEEIANSVAKIGYRKVILDPEKRTVFLPEKGMKIGFGAIGKGYAADMAKSKLIAEGVTGGIINASGDMTVWGKQPDGEEWKVAIINPLHKNRSFALLPVHDGAVVTSGDYEKYVMINGSRHAHIIDPRSGYPAKGIISATIVAPKAEIADALATATFVMGVDAGMDRIEQIPHVECIIVDDTGKVHKSSGIEITEL